MRTVTLQEPLPELVWIYEADRSRRVLRFESRNGDFSVELPFDPMHGTVGVAPASGEARSTLVPDAHGGNMDTPEMRAGTTCFLGVNVEGALFSLGDGHYRQGEGETCGVAVEGAMDTVLIVDLLKNRATPWPRLEDDTYIMSTGSARPLEDAFRIAHGDLVRWLTEEFELDSLDAYQLVSQISESPVANVCDPNYTFVAKAPKRYLPGARRVRLDARPVEGDSRRLPGRAGSRASRTPRIPPRPPGRSPPPPPAVVCSSSAISCSSVLPFLLRSEIT